MVVTVLSVGVEKLQGVGDSVSFIDRFHILQHICVCHGPLGATSNRGLSVCEFYADWGDQPGGSRDET
jgi:hypothetical protein